MRDEAKLRNEAWRGEQAKMILNSSLVVEYFDKKRKVIMHNLETSRWDGKEEQYDLIRMLKLLGDFEKDFKREMKGGEKATSLLKELFNRGKK
jgi:hypothetical protein